MTLPSNGALRSWLLGIFGSAAAALLIASATGILTLRDRVGLIESTLGVSEGARGMVALQERMTRAEARLEEVERWRGEGQRFTKADGQRLGDSFERRMDRIEADIQRLRGRQ